MAARADRRKNASAAARSDRRSGGPGGQTRLFGHEPAPVGASVDPLGLLPGRVLPTVLVVGDETVSGDATVGIVGTNGAIPTVGNTLIVGTAAAELTPRLPISKDPNGIPVRAPPPGVVGDVEVGVDDDDIPDDIDVPDIAVAPDVAAVAGVAAPTAVPPPSKLAVDPNIPDGEVPKVEHAVLLPGIAIVPVELAGIGLTPGDAISVEPSGIPVGETDEPVAMPSGEVAPIVGVGEAIPLTCAMATLLTKSAGSTAAINEYLMGALRLRTASPPRALMLIGFATISLGAKLSDIGQSLVIALRCRC